MRRERGGANEAHGGGGVGANEAHGRGGAERWSSPRSPYAPPPPSAPHPCPPGPLSYLVNGYGPYTGWRQRLPKISSPLLGTRKNEGVR